MKNKNAVIALAAGILFGGLAFFLLYQKASEMEKKTTPVEILVASRYIATGSFLGSEMVEKKAVPESFISPSAVHDIREVDGLSSLVPISSGEQILSNKFGAGGDSLALTLNPGLRAYTLEVNESSGVGNLLRPGNHVDVLTKTDSKNREVTTFVFQNLEILAVGQKLDIKKRAKSGQGTDPVDSTEPGFSYSTVTLAVTPEQAETFMYLEGHPLKLLLRAPHDDEIVSIPAESDEEIMSRLGHFVPKTQSRKIEVIRANSKQGE